MGANDGAAVKGVGAEVGVIGAVVGTPVGP